MSKQNPEEPWTKIEPADLDRYTLPEGITKNCELLPEGNGETGYTSRTRTGFIFIGTNDGVWYASVSPQRPPIRLEARPCKGLRGFSVTKLERRGEDIFAFLENKDVYKTQDYRLLGLR